MSSPTPTSFDSRAASFLVRWRWPLSVLLVVLTGLVFARGAGRIGNLTEAVVQLGDVSDGSGKLPPLVFDPNMDVWFGEEDAVVQAYYEIEDRFVAEDFVMVAFEVPDRELGAFDPQALETIQRLTDRFLTVPGVRHVRSLTYNPWIRWGTIEDDLGSEEGLIISDLVEGAPAELGEEELVERMIATLGAARTAERLGEERVRAILGAEARFEDHIGEPRLLGTILDESGSTTVIQVQVLRPHVDEGAVAALHPDDELARERGDDLWAIAAQRSAVRGIEHFVRLELGLAVVTPEFEALVAEAEALPEGPARDARLLELQDPTRNFVANAAGELVRKYHEYDPVPGGEGYADRTNPMAPIAAPAGFQPEARVPYTFHLGGVPLFERNFEEVGMGDSMYIPLMFLVIVAVLTAVYRRVVGVLAPMLVVFVSILAMVGVHFARGDLFNNLTMMAPNMLTAVAIADAVHLVAAWAALRPRYSDRLALVQEVVRRNALPVLLTSITTSIGFFSLTVSPLAPVTMLGMYAGLGTIMAYLLSMTLVPAVLSLASAGGVTASPEDAAAQDRDPQARSQRWSRFLQKRRLGIAMGAGAMLLVALFGVTRIQIDTDFRGMFPPHNRTMGDFDWIESRMGGVGDLELVFEGHRAEGVEALTPEEEDRLAGLRLRSLGVQEYPDEFAPLEAAEKTELEELESAAAAFEAARIGVSSEFLATLDRFEARLRSEMADPSSDLAVVTDLFSPLDVLRKMHQVQNENQADHYRVPDEGDLPEGAGQAILEFDEWTEEWSFTEPQKAANLVAQYYLQYENGARPGENLTTELSADRTVLRMQGRVVQDTSMAHLIAFERIEEIANEEFPAIATASQPGGEEAVATMTVSGKTYLFARTSNLFSLGFAQSMGIALVVITILIGLIFRSARLAAASLIPNVLPILLPLSTFGLLGIPLHGPAILVSSVALGVCVDDTIHFMTKFVRARRAGEPIDVAIGHVFRDVGMALTVTTIVLTIGFATLLLSSFTPNVMMGALATVMIFLAWAADFLVLPAVLFLTEPREEPAATAAGEPAVATA